MTRTTRISIVRAVIDLSDLFDIVRLFRLTLFCMNLLSELHTRDEPYLPCKPNGDRCSIIITSSLREGQVLLYPFSNW